MQRKERKKKERPYDGEVTGGARCVAAVKKKEEQGKRSRWGKEEERNLPWRSASTGSGASVHACVAVASGGTSERAGPCGGAVL